MTMKIKNIVILLVLTSSIWVLPSIGFAADLVATVNDLQNSFYDAVSNWVGPLQQVAGWLLVTLATISFIWQASFMLLRGTDIQELTVELVRMILFAGFFYWLIQNAPDLTSRLINGWIWLAGEAGGSSVSPNISQILARGVDLAGTMYEVSSGFTVIVAGILGVIIVVLYVLIAAKAFLVTLEMYTVTAAGVILLGFGGNQWTGDYAKRYITYTMATGMKLFVMYLIVATGENFINSWAADSKPETFNDMLSVVGVVLLMLVLVWQLPDTVQGLLSGASLGKTEQQGSAAVMSSFGQTGSAAASVASGSVGAELAIREALKNSEGMPGSSSGYQYKAANAMSNLANAGAEVLGNRIMGDFNASSGGMMASMAQHMRQQRTGGSGLYGGTSSGNDHIGGSATGGSFGAGDPTTKQGTGPEEAENASHDFGGDGDAGGSEAGAGAASWDTSKVGGKEHEFGADDGGSWSWDASGVAAAGGAGESDNPATRYRSPAVDLTRGGVPSFGGGAESSTAKSESGVAPTSAASGIAGGMVGSGNMASGVAASSPSAASSADEQVSTAKGMTGADQSAGTSNSSGGNSSNAIGSMVGADNMTSSMGSSIGADAQGSTTKGIMEVAAVSPSASSSVASSADAQVSTAKSESVSVGNTSSGSGAAPVSSAGYLRSESGASGGSMNQVPTVSAAQSVTASPDLAGTVVGSSVVQAATVGGLGEPSVVSSTIGGSMVGADNMASGVDQSSLQTDAETSDDPATRYRSPAVDLTKSKTNS
ncbi:P-type conjugative transfer protein TrbL [Thiothrix winogradskyi]|uniref:P-type conjugative transfer protein TrbL n=1 Tax=Thiothrix winogradskyi TaxID=96472 RepID=A0ABY3SVR9_9GAMM|nr:P-type conjugative transfer protein TrbL [Thiothrix winogradskyi]UJS23533.1 P-type conjugative transfer protein TrbL [Thiothrix winogradskyi]